MSEVQIIALQTKDNLIKKIPYYTMSVSAGKPIPAENEIETHIDLNELLIEHPGSTFFAKVTGINFKKSGIFDGDVLVIDTSVEPTDGRMIIAVINGELTVKRYRVIENEVFLESHNGQFVPLHIKPYIEYIILGTVTKVIHSL